MTANNVTTAIAQAVEEPSDLEEPSYLLGVHGYSGGFKSPRGFKDVLEDVSFGLREGAMTAIVGETGSGKSVMALSMMGLTASTFVKTAGLIEFGGTDLSVLGDKALRKIRGRQIAMVFQDARAALNPVISVGQQLHRRVPGPPQCVQVGGPQDRRGDAPQGAGARAAQRMRQFPHEFSGGMAQRVMLALALVCEPKLLILDEPTTGLDVTIQADIMELIVDLVRSDGMTACLITHDLGVVAETCDEVVVMFGGKVREIGTCAQILQRPQDTYTQQLLRSSRFEEMSA